MLLEGVVTNVANFGAFVDIGVHQDGLVHVSQLADRFVKDPREVVKAGDIVKVKVVEVDLKRRRIALTMKLQAPVAAAAATAEPARRPPSQRRGAGAARSAGAVDVDGGSVLEAAFLAGHAHLRPTEHHRSSRSSQRTDLEQPSLCASRTYVALLIRTDVYGPGTRFRHVIQRHTLVRVLVIICVLRRTVSSAA